MRWYEQLDEKLRDYLPDLTVLAEEPLAKHTSSASAVLLGEWPFPKMPSSWCFC